LTGEQGSGETVKQSTDTSKLSLSMSRTLTVWSVLHVTISHCSVIILTIISQLMVSIVLQ